MVLGGNLRLVGGMEDGALVCAGSRESREYSGFDRLRLDLAINQ